MKCSICDIEAPPGARFCPHCGGPLDPTKRKSAPRVQGERRHVAIVFADLSGFTAMSAELDPEDVTTLMNRCFDALVDPVLANGGHVDKFIGDCVMALFGAPTAHGDDEIRAVRAALAMRDAIDRLATELRRPIGVSVGVNAGLVVAGHIGSRTRRDYTVMGDAVNLAQRLQSAARRGQVVVGEAVALACADRFELEHLPPLTLKGKGQVVAFEAVRELQRQEGAGGTKRLVGRDAELQLLAGLFDGADAGRGDALCLVGPAGSGKSALLDAAAADARARGYAVLRATCEDHLRAAPYLPVRTLLAQAAGLGAEDDRPTALGRLLSLSDGEQTRERLRLLAPLLPGEGEAPEPPRRGVLLGGLATLLRLIAASGPVVLALDDLHEADPATGQLLVQLPEAVAGAPVVLLATTRPDTASAGSFRSHELAPLEPAAAAELLTGALGATSLAPGLSEALLARAEGNPLFVLHLARSLLDRGAIELDGGRASLRDGAQLAALPDTLRSLLAARVDELPPRPRELLKHASVVGRTFDRALLRSVAPEEWCEELGRLVLQGYLAADGAERFRFRSPLLQQAAYESLLFADRRRLHAKVGGAIERGALAPAERIPLLAHHFARSDRPEAALRWLRAAAERALGQGDPRGALDLARRYRELCDELGPPAAAERLAIEPVRIKGLKMTGAFEEALRAGAEVLAAGGASPALRAELLLQAGQVHAWNGRFEEARALYGQAHELAGSAGDAGLEANVECELGYVLAELGRLDEAEAALSRALAGARRQCNSYLEGFAHNHLGLAALRADALDRAREQFEAGIRLAEAEHYLPMLWPLVCNMGHVELGTGGDEAALAAFERAARVAETAFERRGQAICLANAGAALVRLGRPGEARERSERSLVIATQLALEPILLVDRAVLAAAAALQGRREALDELASAGRELAAQGLDADAADALLLLGIAAAELDPARARAALEEAGRSGERLGRGLAAQARRWLVKVAPPRAAGA